MPLVNVVGVSNLASEYKSKSLHTYSIAVAAISDERTPSYEWVLQTLLDTVWGSESQGPAIFVSDDDHALSSALQRIAPDTPHILCAWHITKNFMAKLGKTFAVDSKEYKEYEKAVNAMIWSRDEKGFHSGADSYRQVIIGTTKETELETYITKYVLVYS